MSSHLWHELADLAAEARQRLDHDGNHIIEKLTVVIGYGHLAETHPQLAPILQRHLEAFADLACRQEQHELCRHSEKILEELRHDGQFKDAA